MALELEMASVGTIVRLVQSPEHGTIARCWGRTATMEPGRLQKRDAAALLGPST